MGDTKMKEYESIINSQKEHINRYEQRLKDIVAAYKGLAKEKAALEASLQAMTAADGKREQPQQELQKPPQATDDLTASADGPEQQVHKLMASIATISAERNRLEEVFQRERKQLRAELANKTVTVKELSDKLSRHGEQALMIRELKKLLADERNLKENLELQLGELKTQFLLNLNDKLGAGGKGSANGGATVNMSESQGKLETSGRLNATLTNSLQELQMEMGQLKKQHSVAVANEKQRARLAEERSKRLGEIHEDRVANLEARITELSTVIGRYDRMQQVDKENILQLKDTIAKMQVSECLPQSVAVVAELPTAADDSGDDGPHDDDDDDKDESDHLKWRYEQCIGENQLLKEEIRSYKEIIVKLKAKADHLNRNIEQLETELKDRSIEHSSMLKREHAKHAEAMAALQAAYEGQIAQLEGKLQNQRERSLTVVEAKDEEIKTLRTSLEILSLSGQQQQQQHLQGERSFTSGGLELKHPNDGTGGGHQHHLLHYAHEFARKDVEITSLRTAKNSIEETLRQALQQKVVLEQTYNQRCSRMQREIERLQLGNSHEGSNHEYLKNVFLSFLLTRDPDSRKHMANAIAAVLKFNDSEMQTLVNSELYK